MADDDDDHPLDDKKSFNLIIMASSVIRNATTATSLLLFLFFTEIFAGDSCSNGTKSQGDNETIVIGCLLPCSGGWDEGQYIEDAFNLAIKEIQSDPKLLPGFKIEGYGADCSKYDTKCDPGAGFEAMEKLRNDHPIDTWVAGGCSLSCAFNSRVAHLRNQVYMSWGCESDQLTSVDNFPYFFRTVPPYGKVKDLYADLIDHFHWKDVILLTDHVPIDLLLSNAIEAEISRRNLERTENETIKTRSFTVQRKEWIPTDNFEEEKAVLRAIEDENLNPRLIIITGYADSKAKMLKALKSLNLKTPVKDMVIMGAQIATDAMRDDFADLTADLEFALDWTLHIEDKSHGWTSGYAYALYDAAYSIAHAYDAIIKAGINPKSAEATARLVDTLKVQNFVGTTGTVAFDENHDRNANYGVVQFKNGMRTTVGTWHISQGFDFSSNIEFRSGQAPSICYAQCSERGICGNDGNCACNKGFKGTGCTFLEEDRNHLPKSLVALGRSLFAVNAALAISFSLWTFVNKNVDVVRFAQPTFLYLIALGTIISSTTILFLDSDDQEGETSSASQKCALLPVFYSLGFIVTFAPLWMKLKRVLNIVANSQQMKILKVPISTLLVRGFLPLLIVDGTILAIWSSSDPLTFERIVLVKDASTDLSLVSAGVCTTGETGNYFLAAIAVFHIGVLLMGNWYVYLSRNIGTAFSDSKYISIAMVSHIQILVMGIPILIIVADNVISNYFVRAGIIFLNDFTVLNFIFLPKILHVYGFIRLGKAMDSYSNHSVRNTVESSPGDASLYSDAK